MTRYKYDAFISYGHFSFDKMAAEKLQLLMESYKPPKEIARLSLKGRVFLDRDEELSPSGDLDADIEDALKKSRYLIVICSGETKNSFRCMEEIELFKYLHKGKCGNIIVVHINGDPNEVFPDSLCHETWDGVEVEFEPFVVNIATDSREESLELLKTEYLRIIAPILGYSFEDLFKQHQRRRKQHLIQISCVGLAVAAAIGIYFLFTVHQTENQRRLLAEQELLIQMEQERLAEQELLAQAEQERLAQQGLLTQAEQNVHTLKVAEELIRSGDKVLASVVLLDLYSSIARHDNFILSEIERLLYQSTYVPLFSPYAYLIHKDSVTSAVFFESSFLISAAKDGLITMWSLINGEHLGDVSADSPVLAMTLENEFIYAVTQTQDVFIRNLITGRNKGFPYFNGRDDLSSYNVDDIMFYEEMLYIIERNDNRLNVRQIDLDTENSSLIHGGFENYFQYCAFDKINNRILTASQQDNGKQLTIYHLEADTFFSINLPDEIDYILFGDNMNYFIAFYELSDTNDFIAFKYDLNGSIIDQIYYNTENAAFFIQQLRETALSPNGRYAAVGDDHGNILVFDLLKMEIISHIETGYAVRFPGFVDDEYIYVSFDSASQGPVIARYNEFTPELFPLSARALPQRMMIDSISNVMCLIDMHGKIALINTGHELPNDHEDPIEAAPLDFTQLIDMAISQTAGRRLTENERQLLMLSV